MRLLPAPLPTAEPSPDPRTVVDESVALLTVTVIDEDRERVDALSRRAVETGLSSYPGLHFTTPPSPAGAFTIFWPTLVPAGDFAQRVTLGDRVWTVAPAGRDESGAPVADDRVDAQPASEAIVSPDPSVLEALGAVVGARSGDKAGNATLGVWARDDAGHDWLRSWWSEERIRELISASQLAARGRDGDR